MPVQNDPAPSSRRCLRDRFEAMALAGADRVRVATTAIVIAMVLAISAEAQAPPAPLVLEDKIPLGPVSGRLDHLAIDRKRQRLFIAELGNNSLGIVDLSGKNSRAISGLSEPQGVAYEPATDTVYVADAGDGSVRVLRGEDLSPIGRIELGEDADNLRVDTARHRVVVGYGSGALAMLDQTTRVKVGDVRLKAHPEGFQIDATRAFVNVPGARLVEVVDLTGNEVAAAWPTRSNRGNFPMAIDQPANRLFVGFRSPARLVVMSTVDGSVAETFDTCGDADDVFVDARRRRVYVTCGAGAVDVFEERDGGYRHIGQVSTWPGARTALFVPEMDRLFVAVRAAGSEPAAVWVLRPD